MANRRVQRHTIYDAMEANGVFDLNPANTFARDQEGQSLYEGPVQYPMMFYHPEGETRVTVPGEIVLSPGGKEKLVGEQREIIWQVARDKGEGDKLKEAGWHDHPAKAIKASGGVVPPTGMNEQISDYERQIAELKKKLKNATAGTVGAGTGTGGVLGRNASA